MRKYRMTKTTLAYMGKALDEAGATAARRRIAEKLDMSLNAMDQFLNASFHLVNYYNNTLSPEDYPLIGGNTISTASITEAVQKIVDEEDTLADIRQHLNRALSAAKS